MNPALFLSLWVFAFGTLLGGHYFLHDHFLKVMHKDALSFEAEWKKLEIEYDRP